jgi:hypothetical protein
MPAHPIRIVLPTCALQRGKPSPERKEGSESGQTNLLIVNPQPVYASTTYR